MLADKKGAGEQDEALVKADLQRLSKQMYNMGTAADVVIIHLPTSKHLRGMRR